MVEKTVSKYLVNLEKYFASSNPVLEQASKTFHQLDQLEYNLGLIDDEESTARKSTWWPIVSFIGGFSSSKADFINRYLNITLHSSNHKFTVHQYTPQTTSATLPGSALDVDYRLPFYQISHQLEQAVTGEGSKINAHLELKTVNSEKLKGKLFIDTPVLNASQDDSSHAAQAVFTEYILNISDLILVFTDLFDASPDIIQATVNEIIAQQDSNKFVYVIDHSEISLDPNKINEIIASWQRRLAELGIHTGQFIVLSDNSNVSISDIDQRLENIENDRSYRLLRTLEKEIRHVNDIYIAEVESELIIWKDRTNMSTFVILGFISTLLVFAELSMSIVQLLFDPIIGSVFLLILTAFIIPVHYMMAKAHAKLIINRLKERQKKLNLTENLSGLFEKSLTFWRIMLPINEPVGKNKKTQAQINTLIEQTKDMVQVLNDQFSHYQTNDVHSSQDPMGH